MPQMPSNPNDLNVKQRTQIINQQLEQLKTERFQHQVNRTRWEAIPEGLRDGTEEVAIKDAERTIAIIEAQIVALLALK